MMARGSRIFTALIVAPSVLLFGGFLVLFGPISGLLTWSWPQQGNPTPLGVRVRRWWASFVLWSHCVKIEIEGPGAPLLRGLRGHIVVMNHQSALDILVGIWAMREDFFFLAKKELLQIPIFGWGAWMSGVIYIDRSKGVGDDRALKVVRNVITRGRSIVIYPEGTRSKDGKLLPFKRGAFVMALQTGAPILPVTILNSASLMPKGQLKIAPGVVRIYVDLPVSTKDKTMEDRHELSDHVRALVAKNLDPISETRENDKGVG